MIRYGRRRTNSESAEKLPEIWLKSSGQTQMVFRHLILRQWLDNAELRIMNSNLNNNPLINGLARMDL